jgi:hypothetical protein
MSLPEDNTVENTPERSTAGSDGTPLPGPDDIFGVRDAQAFKPNDAPPQTGLRHRSPSQSTLTHHHSRRPATGDGRRGEAGLAEEPLLLSGAKSGAASQTLPQSNSALPATASVPAGTLTSSRRRVCTPGMNPRSSPGSSPARQSNPPLPASYKRPIRRTPAAPVRAAAESPATGGGLALHGISQGGLREASGNRKPSRSASKRGPWAQPSSSRLPDPMPHLAGPPPSSSAAPRLSPSGGRASAHSGAAPLPAAVLATDLFAPIAADDLPFECDSLGAAEAFAGQLAQQLGPSIDFGLDAHGSHPVSEGQDSPPSPLEFPSAKLQGRAQEREPLSELVLGANPAECTVHQQQNRGNGKMNTTPSLLQAEKPETFGKVGLPI